MSKIPIKHWDRLELGNSPFGMPLVIPAENKKGKQSVRMIYVADEPRVALAATLHSKENLPARWVIYPPGGRLVVDIDPHSNATLTGPALLIADHDLTRFLQDA
mgnify:CR=1 FL=1